MMTSAVNQSVVITGAAGGMGQAVCREFIEAGYQVLGLDVHGERLNQLKSELGSSFIALEMNLADLNKQVITKQLSEMAPINALINLAGCSIGDDIHGLSEEAWEESLQVNATAPMQLSKLIAPSLKENGGGAILNVSSPVGLIGARKPSYAASKAALTGLTMSLARNLGRDNIRVNLVLPGTTITFMTEDWSNEKRQSIAAGTHLGRLCEPDEFAKTLLFLCSDACSYMSGATVDLTCGGMYGH